MIAEVFLRCHCCDKKISLSDDRFEAAEMSDQVAATKAHQLGWTVGTFDGQTLCPECQQFSDEVAFQKYLDRLKNDYPHYELCQIWGRVREQYHLRKGDTNGK